MVAHVVDRARVGGKRLAHPAAAELYHRAGAVPNDVQWLAHAAFGAARSIGVDHVDAGMASIVARQAGLFAERYESLSSSQRRVVRELARGPVQKVYAKAFLDAVRVANANSVTTALRVLEEREIVRRGDSRWQLAGPFFRAWLLAQDAGAAGSEPAQPRS